MTLLNDEKIILIIKFYNQQCTKLTAMIKALEDEYHQRLEALRHASRPDGPDNEWVVAFKKAGVEKTTENVELVASRMRIK